MSEVPEIKPVPGFTFAVKDRDGDPLVVDVRVDNDDDLCVGNTWVPATAANCRAAAVLYSRLADQLEEQAK